MNIKKLLLYELLGAITVFTFIGIWLLQTFLLEFFFKHDPLRSTIEAIGVMIAIIACTVFVMQARKKKNKKLYLIAMGLISMGLLRGFAGAIAEENTSIFLRSIGGLIGGFWFALVVIPDSEKYLISNKWMPYFIVACTLLFGIWALFFPDVLPEMVYKGSFTPFSVGINLFSGILFLISAIYFLGKFQSTTNLDVFLLSTMCLLFGLSRLAFKFSYTWGAVWWLWQGLQLLAYLVAAILIISWYKNILSDLSFMVVENERVNEILYKSKEWTRLIIDTASEAFISIDSKGLILEWNIQAEKILGWTRQEVIGQAFSALIIPENLRASYDKNIKNYILKGEEGPFLNKRYEAKLIHRHGHEFPVEMTFRPIKLGNIISFNIFLRDITERKKAEKELSVSEARYRLLSENTTEFISVYNQDAICLYVSPASYKLLGFNVNEMIKHSAYEFFHPEDLDNHIYSNVLNSSGIHSVSFRHKCKDGSYICLEGTFRITAHSNSDLLKQVIIVAHQINEQKGSELRFPLLGYMAKTK